MKIKIIYIMGDGRSGSTLLETILNNSESVVSVGECYRFWERYYKNETVCGCGSVIQDCEIWSKVHAHLGQSIDRYEPQEMKKQFKEILLYENFNKMQNFSKTLLPVLKEFYFSIANASGKSVIVDSSKSPSWAKLISLLPDFDIQFIHLERSLPFVVSSWKKEIILPEFRDRSTRMPLKSSISAIRTWIRVKVLSARLKTGNYLFVEYEKFCNESSSTLSAIIRFTKLDLDVSNSFQYELNHGIAGNPIRLTGGSQLVVQPFDNLKPGNLSRFEFGLLRLLNKVCKFLIR